jgi:hypothetical protein
MKNENEFPITTGICKFCGQTMTVETVGEISQSQADEIATSRCTCKEAKVYQNRAGKIKKAREWAENRFMKAPELISLFEESFERVTNHDVEKISIKESDWTHNIFLDSDGFLNVKSSKKVEEEVDFS